MEVTDLSLVLIYKGTTVKNICVSSLVCFLLESLFSSQLISNQREEHLGGKEVRRTVCSSYPIRQELSSCAQSERTLPGK